MWMCVLEFLQEMEAASAELHAHAFWLVWGWQPSVCYTVRVRVWLPVVVLHLRNIWWSRVAGACEVEFGRASAQDHIIFCVSLLFYYLVHCLFILMTETATITVEV